MTEKDKQDCLQGVQEYIKQNTNSKDKEALMQAIEKVQNDGKAITEKESTETENKKA